jgi:hypothetical protein
MAAPSSRQPKPQPRPPERGPLLARVPRARSGWPYRLHRASEWTRLTPPGGAPPRQRWAPPAGPPQGETRFAADPEPPASAPQPELQTAVPRTGSAYIPRRTPLAPPRNSRRPDCSRLSSLNRSESFLIIVQIRTHILSRRERPLKYQRKKGFQRWPARFFVAGCPATRRLIRPGLRIFFPAAPADLGAEK